MITTRYEADFESFYEEHKEFIEERYKEAKALCATSRDLDIDIDLYQEMIDSDTLTVFSIFEADSFVGYCSIITTPSVLSKGALDARIDHIALSEESRSKGYASLVVAELEKILVEQNVDELTIVLPSTTSHNNFAESLSFKKNVTLHTKTLSKGD
jgi:ribosomal protein S18 acetylase RimI-like enzyme